ncbi:MAG TPA: heterodisulfide reductase-related iron-sulfur binding cluster [Candidatus Binatus sp.]|nr:heterodisulfide reductase-related iron-sulfur binding cluster [Candidatus Binatus sp.]
MGSAFVEREKLMACVHCGLCLASCPTYLELGIEADSPRGRIHLMRALAEGQLEPTADVIRHLDLCVGCRACETACPSGVRYGALIEAARPFVEPFRSAPARWGRRLLSSILPTRMPWTVALAARRVLGRGAWLGPLARRLGSPWLAYAAALPVDGVARRLPEVIEPAGRARGTAVLLGGCVADALFRQTNVATALLLHRAGVRVLVPRAAGCCGALALHLGHRERARELARRATAALGAPAADWVVSNAAGCGALLREYGELLPGEPAAAGIATRARDALELLGELGLPEAVRPLRRTVAVHDPCHLAHGQGVRDQARRLLGEIPGIRLVELEESDTCCGSAGTYNLTEPTMARRLLDRKLDRIAASGAEVVAAANPGCILQIRAGAILRGLPVAVEHPIDLLATAHGVAGGSHDQAAVR